VIIKNSIFCHITLCSPVTTDVSEEHIASILKGKSKPSQKSARNRRQAGLFLLFDHENEAMFIRNVLFSSDYKALHPRRHNCSYIITFR
jgi:hypothetical protein